MRTLRNLWIALCTVVAATTLSSCDEDLSLAVNLSGEWQGDFGMYYEYEYRGRVFRFDSYDTRIVFYPSYDYATHGYGKQVDYYSQGPYVYQYYYFNWYVDRGDLVLEYPYDHDLDAVIHDYHMYSNRFYGYFGTSGTRFSLYKTADYYDWANYSGNYYYDPRDGWYDYYPNYVKPESAPSDSLTRSTEAPAESAVTGTDGVVRRGSRFGTAH